MYGICIPNGYIILQKFVRDNDVIFSQSAEEDAEGEWDVTHHKGIPGKGFGFSVPLSDDQWIPPEVDLVFKAILMTRQKITKI